MSSEKSCIEGGLLRGSLRSAAMTIASTSRGTLGSTALGGFGVAKRCCASSVGGSPSNGSTPVIIRYITTPRP
jgi:hypothetical protein